MPLPIVGRMQFRISSVLQNFDMLKFPEKEINGVFLTFLFYFPAHSPYEIYSGYSYKTLRLR